MSLLITLVAVALGATAVFWGVSSFLQPYLYSETARQLPLRALGGGLAVGLYVSLWVFVNTRAERENMYGALHEFNPTGTKVVNEFDAVRKYRAADGSVAREQTVRYKRTPGEKDAKFLDPDGKPFRLADDRSVTAAILPVDGASTAAATPPRFDAEFTNTWNYATAKKVFKEKGGSRFIEGDDPGAVASPNTGVVFAAIALNLGLFAVLFVVFWPGLRYGTGHALGLTALLGLVIMIVVMPLLFGLNKPKPAAVQQQAAPAKSG